VLPWGGGTLEMTDRQRWNGILTGFDTNAVYWQHPATTEPMAVARGQVARCTTTVPFARRSAPPPMALELASDERISGDVLEWSAQALRLRTEWTNTISLPRAQLVRARLMAPPEGVLGTGEDPNWSQTAGDMRAMATNANRALPEWIGDGRYTWQGVLPERWCAQFELYGDGDKCGLFFGARDRPGDRECCALSLSLTLACMNYAGANPAEWKGDVFRLDLSDSLWGMDVIWLLDRERREAHLLLNGRVIGRLETTSELPGRFFSVEGSEVAGAPFRQRRVRLSAWRGGAELLAQVQTPAVDCVWRHDMTCLTGAVTRIGDGRIVVTAADGAETQAPFGAVSWIGFRASGVKPARAGAGTVKAYLPEGDRILLSAARWEKDEPSGQAWLAGRSVALGEVRIPAEIVVRIEFHPRDAR
jgi:hypothetical protein